MSQDARMREVIDATVARAVEPLKRRVDELSSRLTALEDLGGPAHAEAQKRPPTARTARAKGSSDGTGDEAAKAGQ
jgi:hypothetical protein